jgi:hypothetical protein
VREAKERRKKERKTVGGEMNKFIKLKRAN